MKKEDEKINTAQVELSKLYSKWGKQQPTLKDFLKKETRKSFERAGFKIIDGEKNISLKI